MDLQLENKRALVSGSTVGIGFAIAESLAREGASVIITGRSQARVDESLKKLRGRGFKGEISGVAADLSTKAGADALTKQIPTVDILINNLGMYAPKPFEEISDEEWLKIFEVNVLSGIR